MLHWELIRQMTVTIALNAIAGGVNLYRHAYKVMKNRIAEIKHRQFQILNYLDSNSEILTEFQKENMNGLLAVLKEEREQLEMILKIII